MRKVRTHRFNGVKYEIDLEPADGFCDLPDISNEKPSIMLPNGLPTENEKGARQGLVILLHECLHAASGCWNYLSDDEKIDRIAREIGLLLWRLGYRRNAN